MKKSVTVRRRHANNCCHRAKLKKSAAAARTSCWWHGRHRALSVCYALSQKTSPPSCLHCNFFVPKLIAIILAEYYTQQQLQLGVHVCILFPFMAVLCMLALACSVNIQS